MLADVIIYIFATFASWLAALLPNYSIYPENFLSGIEFFGEKIASLNFFIFDIPRLMIIFVWLVGFESYYFIAYKIGSIISFFRGSEKIDI